MSHSPVLPAVNHSKTKTTAPLRNSHSGSKKQRRLKNFSTATLYCIFYLLWTAAALLAPQFIVYYPMRLILGTRIGDPSWIALHNTLSYLLSAVLALYLPHKLLKRDRLTRESLGFNGLPKWSDILLAPIGFFVYVFSATVLAGLFSKFPFYDGNQAQNLGYGNLLLTSDKLLVFITITIVAPLVEELIFRGWLYAKLRARIRNRASLFLSIFLTSLLFAILHGQWNVGVNVFCLSIVLCLLREVTGTIHSGIILHMLKNAIAFFLLYML